MQTKNSTKPGHWRFPTWPPAVTFGLIFIIYLVVALLRLDPDFGWHLQAGNYFWIHGLPKTDIFTYTASNFPWVDHEWLSDVLLARLYNVGGYSLLCGLYAGLWTLSLWLVGRRAHGVVVLLAALATLPFTGVRAVTWSVLGLALLICLIQAKRQRFWVLIPLLFLTWANVHGGFIAGLFYGVYDAIRRRSWLLIGLVAVGAFLTLVNPYGLGLYTEVWRTISDTSLHSTIDEWSSFSMPWITLPYIFLWLVGIVLVSAKKWRNHWRNLFGMDVLFFVASVSSMRNIVLFVIVSLEPTSQRIHSILATIPSKLDRPRQRFVITMATLLSLAVLAIVVGAFWGVSLDREPLYPRNAVAYLRQHPCEGNIFNHYDYGGYLIWKLPNQKVYIDGRMPSWQLGNHKYFNEYSEILKSAHKREAQFAKYNVKCVIMSKKESGFIDDLKKQHWRVVADDPKSLLLLQPKK